jgi:hypothetical protein
VTWSQKLPHQSAKTQEGRLVTDKKKVVCQKVLHTEIQKEKGSTTQKIGQMKAAYVLFRPSQKTEEALPRLYQFGWRQTLQQKGIHVMYV